MGAGVACVAALPLAAAHPALPIADAAAGLGGVATGGPGTRGPQAAGAKAWAAASARNLARRLRRQRREVLGQSLASAMARRCNIFRAALAAQWRFGAVLGRHYPTLRDSAAAAVLSAAAPVGLSSTHLVSAARG